MKQFSRYITEEYVHEMSRSDKDEFESHITNLLTNHLQIQYVGGRDVNHWQKEIRAWEETLFRLIGGAPGLKSYRVDLEQIYAKLVRRGPFPGDLREKFPTVKFPDACPLTLQQVVGNRVWNELSSR